MRINDFKFKTVRKAAILVAAILMVSASASFGQQINLTAAPTTTTLPDGTTVPMWGYFCGTAVSGSTVTCAALNPASTMTLPATWSPVVITVPVNGTGATSLTINLTNNLSFTPTGTTTANNIPTSVMIVGQVGGGLGDVTQRTTTQSPDHSEAQGCVTWFIADASTPPGTPCTTSTPIASPPVQGPRVQSFSTEVAAVVPGTVASTALTWSNLRPGTYLLESGTHPSIQVPMGLIGMVVVTTAPVPSATAGTAGTPGTAYLGATPVTYNAEVPLEFSEIDPVQNNAVNTAVNTAGFSETAVWTKMNGIGTVTAVSLTSGGSGYVAGQVLTLSGGTGTAATATVGTVDSTTGAILTLSGFTGGNYTTAPTNPISLTGGTTSATVTATLTSGGCGTANTCYPPAVNYTPFYYLINGVAFSKTSAGASLFAATAGSTSVTVGTVTTVTPVTSGIAGTVLARLVNAGLRMHVPSIVGSQTTGFNGTGAATTVNGFALIAEDGNPIPGSIPLVTTAGTLNAGSGAPRVQTHVFMAAGKVYDVMFNVPASGAPALPIYDRELSLSGNSSERDAGMLAYIGVNGSGLPALPGAGANGSLSAKANPDNYPSLAAAGGQTQPFSVTDVSKGVIANDINVYGVALLTGPSSTGPNSGTLSCPATSAPGICANGTFTYTPNAGSSATKDGFTYCANGTVSTAGVCSSGITTTVTLGPSTLTGTLTAIAQTYTATTATYIKVPSPGLLLGNTDPNNLALSLVTSNPPAGVTWDAQGGFIVSQPGSAGGNAVTFTYTLQNSQGQTASNMATVNFPAPSHLKVQVLDAQAYNNCQGNSTCIAGVVANKITDYRWIIEEDKTFWVDPNCTANTSSTNPGCPAVVGPAGTAPGTSTIPTFAVNFHTSNMDYVAQGCTGPLSCEYGQTMLDTRQTIPNTTPGGPPLPNPTFGRHINAVCDLGNGACRPDTGNGTTSGGFTWVDPGQVHLDPAKRYYISVLPGDAGNPFPAYTGAPGCDPTTGAQTTATGGNPCGHTQSGAPIPAACNILLTGACTTSTDFTNTTVNVLTLPTPLPTGKLSVMVFEDDFPLNGEQDGGGGVDTLSAQEPGLGGFNLVLWDTFGGLGDVTGQNTYDMFNQPLSNALAGTIDPSTNLDACPISPEVTQNSVNGGTNIDPVNNPQGSQAGIIGMIVTCPKYESDNQTLSPLAGQAVIANLMPEKFSVQAYPGADRIARGEEWIQTNTLDGQHAHDSFIRIGEPSYFQEYGPAGYHVSIGFANPAIINARAAAVCAGNYGAIPGGNCNNTITGQVGVQRLSRTPDQRLYPSGSRDALAWTQCWVSLGDPDAEDFMFTKCDAQGNFTFTGVPTGNWRLTIGDQWNDQIIDGLSTPANVGCINAPACPGGQTLALGSIGVQQWQSNLYTKTCVDDNRNGICDKGEIGIPLVYTRIRYRDGHNSNALTTDFNGVANFNETFPLFNWYTVEADTGRYKTTGIHTVYDAGGPADGTCGTTATAGARPCGTGTTVYNFLANTYEAVPLPSDLSVPGAIYCAAADCSAEGGANTGGTLFVNPTTTSNQQGISTGRIDPPWVYAEGWSGMTSQGNWIEFAKAPFAECDPSQTTVSATNFCVFNGGKNTGWGENGGIFGFVDYSSTRPFDSAEQMIQQPWEPWVPHVTIDLYQEGFAADGVTPTLTMVDTTQTSSWDDWAQGFYPGTNKPYMSCPGQGTATGTNADLFFYTLYDQPNYLDWYNSVHAGGTLHTLPYNSQYKCYDAMHIWNQVQPAMYDGRYSFPSVLGIDPKTGKQITPTGYINPITGVAPTTTGTNCTICVPNPDTTDLWRVGTPMLPPGKYVVEVIMPKGYEVYKEEDKNLLIGDNYIAPATQQFSGLGGDIFIIPDQANVASLYDPNNSGYNPNNFQNQTTGLALQGGMLSGVPGYPGFQDPVWPCVGEMRVVPDFLSLFPQVQEVAPFAGAVRPLCDRKEVTLSNQMSVTAKFAIFTSTHIASKFTGVITDDFTSEFDPFSPQFGEKYAPANMPISTRDYLGNEISRVYSDHFGIYDGLNYSSWEVNPPNITGYSPTMMVQCMNDSGPILDTNPSSPTYGKMITDPLYNPAYSNFCYEEPYMPGLTTYLDTPVVPTQAFVGAGYNNADCAYPDATPAIAEVDGDGIGPWVSAAGKTLTITALGNASVADANGCFATSLGADTTVTNYGYAGPSASVAPFNCKTVSRHYGFGTQGTGSSVVLVGSDGVKHPLTSVSWSDTTITGGVPAGLPNCTIQQQAQYGGSAAQCGELVITAANGKQSVDTVTVTIGGSAPSRQCDGMNSGSCHVSATSTIQSAIDAAAPGDLIIVDPTCSNASGIVPCTTAGATKSAAAHNEMLIMWKPVRLQGVGAASTIINANTSPAGKQLDPWRRHITCLFGLTLQGAGRNFTNQSYDTTYSCPDSRAGDTWNYFTNNLGSSGNPLGADPQIDRLPSEGVIGWDASLNGNLAELLQEPSLMGAYEGAGITVLGKGVDMHGGNPWDPTLEGAFPTGSTLLSGVVSNPGGDPGTAGALLVGDANPLCTDGAGGANRFPSNFTCNPSRIDGLSVTNSSQGGGGMFVHGWAHYLEISNNRVFNNAGTLSGGISDGQGEFGPVTTVGGGLANLPPGSCADELTSGFITNQHLPWCLQVHTYVHNNMITNNSSIGDELFSATLSGGGGATVCTGADYYKFNYNWVCGNLSAGEGGGMVHLGEIQNGHIEHNSFVFNQSSNPTIPTNGGGIQVMGTPDTDPTCPGVPDADCPSGLSDGTGHGLVINANLIQGNSADSGSGGGIRLQQVNGTEVGTFSGVYAITAANAGRSVTIAAAAGSTLPLVGDSITIAGVSVAGYNGTFTVTGINTGARTFTYFDPTAGLGRGTGGTFTDTTAAGTAQNITSATEAGATVVTITSALSPTAGDRVTIAGVAPGGYDGTFTVTCTPLSVTSAACPTGATAAGTFTYTGASGLPATGTGGTVTDSNPNQATASLWNSVSITNNIIVNNMAGWDGAGISLQDALNVNIISNTIAHNDSLASSGVLTQSIGTPQASAPAGHDTCAAASATASCPQSAGLTTTPNSSLMITAMNGLTITCPPGHLGCTGFSNPILYNDIFWQNRSFHVGVATGPGGTPSGTGNLNQQNIVSLYTAFTNALAPSQTFTGECSAKVSYWDIGVRGDTNPTTRIFTMSPMRSVLSSGGYGGAGNSGTDPAFTSEYCNGSRVPPECTVTDGCGGPNGFGVPPGIADAVTPNPVFSLTPSATVDEGNNWINVSWGPLSMTNPSLNSGTGNLYGNYGGGLPLGNYSLLPSSTRIDTIPCPGGVGPCLPPGEIIATPATDFYGNPRPDARGAFDPGAVEAPGGGTGTGPGVPTLTLISPNSAPRGRSVQVTLEGTNLIGVNAGSFHFAPAGGISVGGVTVLSSTQVSATFTITGTATPGARSVTVTTAGGTSNAVTFYVGPYVVSISPTSGTHGTSVPVTISGVGLTGASAIVFTSGSGITTSPLTVVNDTTVTATFTIASGATVGGHTFHLNVGATALNNVTFTVQ